MGTHAVAWLLNQYRCVLGRMRAHEFRQAHPIPSEINCSRHGQMKVEPLEFRLLLSGTPEIDPAPGDKNLRHLSITELDGQLHRQAAAQIAR